MLDDESLDETRAVYGDEFISELEAMAERFEERGIRTESDLVFDHDRTTTRQRLAEREDVYALLLPGAVNTLGKVLITSRDLRNVEKRAALLNIVDQDGLISSDLVHIADPDDPEGQAEGEHILQETASILTEAGVPQVQLDREVRTGTDVAFELARAARGHDLVVLGETEQDIGERIFGPVGEYIVEKRDVPVLVVR